MPDLLGFPVLPICTIAKHDVVLDMDECQDRILAVVRRSLFPIKSVLIPVLVRNKLDR